MPVKFQFPGAEELAKKLETMAATVMNFGNVELYEGMHNWQIEDMKRQYPETIREGTTLSNTYTVYTMIYPRSRTRLAKRPRVLSENPRAVARRQGGRPTPSASHRPILREELLEAFNERLKASMTEKIKWG